MYCLGTKILELAHNVPKKSVQETSLPIMAQLSGKTGETVTLTGLREHDGICLEKVDGHHAFRVSFERGTTFPLHAGASGKVLLAHLDPQKQGQIIKELKYDKFSETTITEPKQLKAEIATISKQGFALSNGEMIHGTYGIAAPIFSLSRNVIAALSISAPNHRLEEKQRKQMVQLIVAAANKITDELALYET
jgi:DNA-binding IclR family transcriptional regulator